MQLDPDEGCKDGVCPVPWLDEKKEDLINSPSHYASTSIECIDAIKAQLSEEEFKGYLKGNIVKYIWREKQKGQKESLKKAKWYLDRLLEF